ncbi:hypothetical protein PLEOSDRAFT_1087947, partial [Pleurotus ostreatus PC15]
PPSPPPLVRGHQLIRRPLYPPLRPPPRHPLLFLSLRHHLWLPPVQRTHSRQASALLRQAQSLVSSCHECRLARNS